MPYEINWEKKGVLVRFNGIFSYKENMNANIELYSDSKFENLKYIIWDLSKISEVNINEEEAKITGMQDKLTASKLPEVKMAIVALDKRVKNLCHEYVAYSQNINKGWTFMVSDNLESIRTWVSSNQALE